MSDELRNAFYALMEAMDKELTDKENHIRSIEDHAQYLESQNKLLKTNLKEAAGVLTAAAHALQEGLNDY